MRDPSQRVAIVFKKGAKVAEDCSSRASGKRRSEILETEHARVSNRQVRRRCTVKFVSNLILYGNTEI